MEVKNPIIDFSTNLSANGKVRVITAKEFKELGFKTGAEFKINEGDSIIYAYQELTKNIKARISSNQTNRQKLFANDADKKLEMIASFPFNL
jgi:hypothetical protein